MLAVFNPHHACIDRGKGNTVHQSDVFTACVASSNTYDYDSDVTSQNLNIPAHFYFPKTSKKVPIIIISHGAGGIFQFHHDYKDIFLSNEIAVVIIDHFSPRNIAIDFDFVSVSEAMMLSDITATLEHLTKYYGHRLDGQVGYIGWSKGGISALSLRNKKIYDKYIPSNIKLSFLAGVYTFCDISFEDYQPSDIPLLLISGELDEITPAKYCMNLFNEFGESENISYHQLANSYHGFDNHAFLLGAYLPWQPTLNESDICSIVIDKSLKTISKTNIYSLNDFQSRKEFIEACTVKGAFVKYNPDSTIKSHKLVIDFVKTKFGQN